MRQEFTKATKLAAFQRADGHCEKCTAKLYPTKYEFHHDKECTFGGDGNLTNAIVLCVACHSAITRDRARDIAKSSRVRMKHLGTKKRQTFRGWRRMNGEAVYADDRSD